MPKNKEKKIPEKQSFVNDIVRVKVSSHLSWVYPYLNRARHKMPSLILPKQIKAFKPTPNRIMRVFGNVHFQKKLIVMSTHNQQTYINNKGQLKVKKVVRLSKARILDTLAHELAHLSYPDHGYEHEQYSKMIFKTFGIKEKCPHCRGSGKVIIESKP